MQSGLCLLAIETATDACSLALQQGEELRALHEVAPRAHSARLFAMLQSLFDGQSAPALGLDAVVYGSGPGSFTGLRIAASAAQGLAFSLSVPAIGVSTLAAQVLSAHRDAEGAAALHRARAQGARSALVLSTLDANIGELYWALYRLPLSQSSVAVPVALLPAAVCTPQDFDWAALRQCEQPGEPLLLIGSGVPLLQSSSAPAEAAARALASLPALLPAARDLLPLAAQAYAAGEVQTAAEIAPLYVRKPTEWKTLAEQGSPL
jgi:tRNA threonylcarbamoyladenosine biosynthesis protein TsaB